MALQIVLRETNPLKLRGVLAGAATADGAFLVGNLKSGEGVARATGEDVTLAGKLPELRQVSGAAVRGPAWYVAGFSGVFRSTDAGKVWTRVVSDAKSNVRGVGVDAAGRVWALHDDGTIVWSDDGAQWTKLGRPSVKSGRVATAGGRVYFLGKGVVATVIGDKLVTAAAGKEPLHGLAATADGVLVAGGEDGYLYRAPSAEGELQPFTRSRAPIAKDAWIEAVAAHDGGVVVASGNTLWFTADGTEASQLATLPGKVIMRSLTATSKGTWIGAEHLPGYEGTLAWLPARAAVATTAPSAAATRTVPSPAPRVSPRRDAAALAWKEREELSISDAFKRLALGKTLIKKLDAFDPKQRVLLFDGHLRTERLEAPSTAAGPTSIVVRGDLDVDGIELASDDKPLFLIVTGELRARYAWLFGTVHVHVAKGARLSELIVATGGDDDGWLDVRGGLSAQAIVQTPGSLIQVKGRLDALVIGTDDEVPPPAYGSEDAPTLFVPAALDDNELDPDGVRKLLRAKKPVFLPEIPAP
jgi:hypothetical protein